MRLAILADIHGNLPALQAVLADLAGRDVDQIVMAGDAINWGPFSAAVLDTLAHSGSAPVRGNHEYFLLDYATPRAPEWGRDAPSLAWLARQLEPEWRRRIAAWPDTLSLRYSDAPPVRVVHGLPGDPFDGIFPWTSDGEIRQLLSGVEEELVIAGHTHIALDRRVDGRRILNPGSVGLPLDGVLDARYLLLDAIDGAWQPTFRRVPYDAAPLFEEFERLGFVAECGAVGYLIIEEFRRARPVFRDFLRWRRAHCAAEPMTLELAERFLGR